jgi:hypothetical protein
VDQTGLINDIFAGAYNIDDGRKGFAIRGKEQRGRISYEDGIALAMAEDRAGRVCGEAEECVNW